jgi:hypothetical protein
MIPTLKAHCDQAGLESMQWRRQSEKVRVREERKRRALKCQVHSYADQAALPIHEIDLAMMPQVWRGCLMSSS